MVADDLDSLAPRAPDVKMTVFTRVMLLSVCVDSFLLLCEHTAFRVSVELVRPNTVIYIGDIRGAFLFPLWDTTDVNTGGTGKDLL
jgi:hypothetical protein